MVDVAILRRLEGHYHANLNRYKQNHAGDMVLLREGAHGINEKFFMTPQQLTAFTKENIQGDYGPTFFSARIPFNTAPPNSDSTSREI